MMVESMKKKNKILIIATAIFALVAIIFFYLQMYSGDNVIADEVIATVNGEEIYQTDYDRIKELNSNLSDDEAIKLVMKELLVYQEAYRLGFSVNEEDLNARINQLKTEMPDLYSLCIKQYGSETAYRTALSYTMLYNMVYDYHARQYIKSLNCNIDIVVEEILGCGYASAEEIDHNKDEVIISFLKEKHKEKIKSNFEDWNEREYEQADKEYIRFG